MKDFLIATDDHQIRKGDQSFGQLVGDANATLESFDHDGDFVVLTYTGGLTVRIPEARIAFIAALD